MISSYYITDFISCNKKDSQKVSISDFVQQNEIKHYSRNSIFTIAIMDWLLRKDFHTKSLIKILRKYHACYPTTNFDRYGNSLESWFNKGAKWYRIDYSCDCIAWCGIIAWFAKDMNQLKNLIKRAIKATNNSESSLKYCEMLAVTMYLNLKHHSYKKTKNYLAKHYGYTPSTPLLMNHMQTKTDEAKTISFQALDCFFATNNYIECVELGFDFNSNFNIIAHICGMIAESFYNETSIALSHYFISHFPSSFIDIIYKFDKLLIN